MPLRTKVGPDTSLGPLRGAVSETNVAFACCCLANALLAAAKHSSRLAHRRAPGGCVGVAGALPDERHASGSPPRASQPTLTPSVTAQPSALRSGAPTP